jgi:hypothetical protein
VPPDKTVEPLPPTVDPTVLRLPFLVDDYFVPNGCFGDNTCQGTVIDINSRACVERPASAQSVCRRYTYTPLAAGQPGYEGFLGIHFQDVGPNGEAGIGQVRGLKVEAGAKRLVFWAAVSKGSTPVYFKAGGIVDPALPYRDDFELEIFPMLTPELTQFEIDLSGVTYDEVVSPFGWAIESNGSTEPIELFVDDVRWE